MPARVRSAARTRCRERGIPRHFTPSVPGLLPRRYHADDLTLRVANGAGGQIALCESFKGRCGWRSNARSSPESLLTWLWRVPTGGGSRSGARPLAGEKLRRVEVVGPNPRAPPPPPPRHPVNTYNIQLCSSNAACLPHIARLRSRMDDHGAYRHAPHNGHSQNAQQSPRSSVL
jgi:hypothetical protein